MVEVEPVRLNTCDDEGLELGEGAREGDVEGGDAERLGGGGVSGAEGGDVEVEEDGACGVKR